MMETATDKSRFSKHVLPSGLTVYFQYRDQPWFRCAAIVGAGYRHEPAGTKEVAHLVEHLVFDGTLGRPVLDLIRRRHWLTRHGVDFDEAETSQNGTYYGGRALAKSRDFFFDYLRDFLLRPSFDRGLDKEKAIIKAEMAEKLEPRRRNSDAIRLKAIFGRHHLAMTSLWPTESQIDSLAWADVRNFHRRHYHSRNLTLAIVGGLDRDQLLAQLDRLFPSPSPGQVVPIAPRPIKFGRPDPVEHVSRPEGGRAATAKIDWYWHFPPDPASEQALIVLCGSLYSLLTTRLRERSRLVYGIDAFAQLRRDFSVIRISTEVAVDKTDRVRRLVAMTAADVPALKREAAKHLPSVVLGRRLAEYDAEDETDRVVNAVLQGTEPTPPSDRLALLEAVTPEQVARLQRKIIRPGRCYVDVFEET